MSFFAINSIIVYGDNLKDSEGVFVYDYCVIPAKGFVLRKFSVAADKRTQDNLSGWYEVA